MSNFSANPILRCLSAAENLEEDISLWLARIGLVLLRHSVETGGVPVRRGERLSVQCVFFQEERVVRTTTRDEELPQNARREESNNSGVACWPRRTYERHVRTQTTVPGEWERTTATWAARRRAVQVLGAVTPRRTCTRVYVSVSFGVGPWGVVVKAQRRGFF